MNNKGDFTGLLFFVVSIAAFGIFLLIVGYVVPQIYTQLQNQMGVSVDINNSFSSGSNVAQNTLPVIWMIMFGGLLLGLMATAWFVPSHPIFAPIFGILMVITIFVSIALSNAYQSLAANATLSSTAADQGAIGFILNNLPYVSFAIGILVLIISYAKPGVGGGDQGGIPM